MTFKEFSNWCNERACDGCWSMNTAIYCIGVCETINKEHFWKKEKIWKDKYEQYITTNVIDVINKKMKEYGYIN